MNLLRPLGEPLGPTADRASFDRVIRTGRRAVGGIGPLGTVSGKQLVALRLPITRNGELRYVLSIQMEPRDVSAILRGSRLPEGWVGAVVDAGGRIVARTLSEPAQLGQPASPFLREAVARGSEQGVYHGRTLEGVDVYTVYRTLPITDGWSVHFGIPDEVLDAPVRRSLMLMLAGAGASVVLSVLVVGLLARDFAQRRRQDQRRAADALRASEERRAMAVEAAALGTWHWDIEQDAVDGCDRWRVLLDLPRTGGARAGPGGSPYKALVDAIHPDDRAVVQAAVKRCLEEEVPLDVEFRAVWRDGSVHWLRATGRALRAEGEERPVRMDGVVADIGDLKRAEEARRDMFRRLAQAQEDERRRIARELHDQVGQTVTGLSLGLKSLEQSLELGEADGEARERVRWLQSLTTEIGRDIHNAAVDLRPTALDDLGLHKALLTSVSRWSERFGVAVDVQAFGLESRNRLPAEVETVIYRAVQEALTNVLKHAQAHNVSLVLKRDDQHLQVIIEDDGQGFDPDYAGQTTSGMDGGERPSIGLPAMRERLALVGGELSIEAAPGSGSTLFIRVALDGASPRHGAP